MGLVMIPKNITDHENQFDFRRHHSPQTSEWPSVVAQAMHINMANSGRLGLGHGHHFVSLHREYTDPFLHPSQPFIRNVI